MKKDIDKDLGYFDMDLNDYKYYQQTLHAYKTRMSFYEAMQKSPYFNFKATAKKDMEIIVRSNNIDLNKEKYLNKEFSKFVTVDGVVDENGIENKFKLIEINHEKKINELFASIQSTLDDLIDGVLETNDYLLKVFTKSYRVQTTSEDIVITNWLKVDWSERLDILEYTLDSHVYKEQYKCDFVEMDKLMKPFEFHEKHGTGLFNQKNFTYTCLDNPHEYETFIEKYRESSINSKQYIVESLAKVEDNELLEDLLNKKYYIACYIGNRINDKGRLNFKTAEITINLSDIDRYKRRINHANQD